MSSECYCTQFRRSANALTSIYDQELRPLGIKITQLALLRELRVMGPTTFNDVATALALDKSTLSRNIRVLIDAGWVNVSGDTDARVKVATLSDDGARVLKQAEPGWRRAQAQVEALMEASFNRPAKTALMNALGKLQKAGEEEHVS